MTSIYKVLGQLSPAAGVDAALYTVPAATQAVSSTINICNRDANSSKFRIAVRPAGAPLAAAHYLCYDTLISANDSISLTLGVTLGATDIISVRSATSTVSFSAFGTEIVA